MEFGILKTGLAASLASLGAYIKTESLLKWGLQQTGLALLEELDSKCVVNVHVRPGWYVINNAVSWGGVITHYDSEYY